MSPRKATRNAEEARHARRSRASAPAHAQAPAGATSKVASAVQAMTWVQIVIFACVGIAILALIFFGIASCERKAHVGAWQSEVAQAAELTHAALQAGYEDRVASLKEPLDKAKADLDAVVRSIEQQGFDVGYYVAATDGEELFSYHADEVFYAASSIKGPYVLSNFSEGVPSGGRGLVEEAIQWSDNAAYWYLRVNYGYEALTAQLLDIGVSEEDASKTYVHLTPAQLATLWLKNYWVLDDSPDAEFLRSVFESPENAPVAALGEGSYSKGGWIATESLHCTVDAGIVDHGDNRYVMAAMISAGEDEELLGRLVTAIDAYEQADYAYLKATGELS